MDHTAMRRAKASSPRSRWPAGFLGTLALCVVVEAGLARSEADLEPMVVADWSLDRRDATSAAVGAKILCLGDSLIKCGVVPAVLEARLGLPSFNLAAIGATTPATLFLLERALAAGADPRALVLDASPTTLSAFDYRTFARNWAALIDPSQAIRLAWDCCDPVFPGLYLAHQLVPSVRMRLDLRESIGRVREGSRPAPAVSWRAIVARQHAVNRGAFYRSSSHPANGTDPYPDGGLAGFEERICYPEAWAPHWLNLVYLGKALDLAESRGITVFFLIPPIHPGVQAVRERRGLDASYLTLVRKIAKRYRNVAVVDARHLGFDHGLFADSHHLTRDGAVALSESLAPAIAAGLDGSTVGGRWVELPAAMKCDVLPTIEDVDQSRLALAAGRGAIR